MAFLANWRIWHVSKASLINCGYIMILLLYYFFFFRSQESVATNNCLQITNPSHGCILTSHCGSCKFSGTKLKASPCIQTILLSFIFSLLKSKELRVFSVKRKFLLPCENSSWSMWRQMNIHMAQFLPNLMHLGSPLISIQPVLYFWSSTYQFSHLESYYNCYWRLRRAETASETKKFAIINF